MNPLRNLVPWAQKLILASFVIACAIFACLAIGLI